MSFIHFLNAFITFSLTSAQLPTISIRCKTSLFFVQYASEKWINHSCLNHSRLFSFQLSTTENAVGENRAVQFVLLLPHGSLHTPFIQL